MIHFVDVHSLHSTFVLEEEEETKENIQTLFLRYQGEFLMQQFVSCAYLLSRDQQDLVLGLLQALLGARDLDLVAGVVRSWDLDFSGGLELQLLKLLPVLSYDETMVLLGDGNSS